jgi:hypothetical protein
MVLMINANDDSRMAQRIQQFIARKFHWPDSGPPTLTVVRATSVTPAMLRPAAGRYEFHNNDMLTLTSNDTALSTLTGGLPDEEFLPEGGDRFASREGNARFTLERDASAVVTGLRWVQNGKERTIPRVGPLIEALQRQPDPDPAMTDRILSTLTAIMRGGEAVKQAPYLTAGARGDFDRGAGRGLKGMRDLSFIAVESVSGRGVERHGGQVARIAYYALTTGTGKRYVMVHLTPDNMVTDFDLVDN